ncbi:hypothetical protein KTS45_04875 [Halomicroarcula limicola]|uniref:Uncharacterized protein n=1 Tax=Haloarcula limicola TaxID=1429915 RepID=A0A8J7Y3V3_9EURY|nr:hypothetical protein [Halomicroarcula limicola]MBV0923527.1 hypothetical protein [Halomicroarcula limicola]
MVPLLLFPGVPGGIELLVIFVMMAVFLVVPLGLVVVAYLFGKRRGRAETTDGDGTKRVE